MWKQDELNIPKVYASLGTRLNSVRLWLDRAALLLPSNERDKFLYIDFLIMKLHNISLAYK